MNLAGNTASGAKSSRTLVPLLVILFLTSYGLLTTLVVEQGKTIDSQSSLMHLLLRAFVVERQFPPERVEEGTAKKPDFKRYSEQ